MIDPAWLLRALSISIGVALLCGYSTFCLLFYQGQWQLVLHPTHEPAQPVFNVTSGDTTAPQEIHFGPDASGTPQLRGWWVSAPQDGRFRHLTLLYLPSGDGQLSTASPLLRQLHALGINLFAFDYRGFGASSPVQPNQARMKEDATTALAYLLTLRGVPPGRVILYGSGVGASLAVDLASANAAIPALILDDPKPDLLAAALADSRARILPVRLLFKERFTLFPALANLHTPKLFLTRGGGDRIASAAAQPWTSVDLTAASDDLLPQSLSLFLDQYAPHAPSSKPGPRPVPEAGAAAR